MTFFAKSDATITIASPQYLLYIYNIFY